jgi:hypothetical protein
METVDESSTPYALYRDVVAAVCGCGTDAQSHGKVFHVEAKIVTT